MFMILELQKLYSDLTYDINFQRKGDGVAKVTRRGIGGEGNEGVGMGLQGRLPFVMSLGFTTLGSEKVWKGYTER